MPDYPVRHKNKAILPYLLSLPTGSTDDDVKAAVAALGDGNWSLDPKIDPVELAAGVDVAAPSPNSKEK